MAGDFIVNVEAAIYKDDKWLIIRRSKKEENAPGKLSLVGGKVEDTACCNNLLEENLRREIMEEVGIDVDSSMEYIESTSFITNKGKRVINIVFLCRYIKGEPRCASKYEVDEVYWMTRRDINNDNNAPIYLKNSIERAEEKRTKNVL